MSKVRKGVLIALVSSNASMIISFIASVFLARLLTPTEIGIFSVAFVFAGLLRTIRELGLGTYIVQERELTDERLRTAFGISILIAVVTGGMVAALAGFAGDFYQEAGITRSLYVVGLSFLLVPFGSTTMAFLLRNMHFKDLAVVDFISILVQNGSAVLLAWLGFSYMSLAWAALMGTTATVICSFFFRPSSLPWMPSLREWRRVMGFSAFSFGTSLVNYANQTASDLVLGKMLNMESVALFNRANGLSELLNGIIARVVTTVGLPYFSQQGRDGIPPAPAFIEASTIIAMITSPVYAVLAIVAAPAILLLFGSQWVQSIAVLQILCVAAILRGPAFLTNQVMTAAGGIRQQLNLDILGLMIKFAAVIVCAGYGLQAVAWGYCFASVVAVVLKVHVLNRMIDSNWTALWPIAKYGLLTAALSTVGPTLIMAITPNSPPLLTLAGAGLTALAGWMIAVFVTTNPLKPNLIEALTRLRKRSVRD